MSEQPISLKLTPKQTLAWQTLDDPAVSSLLYGGSKGGGKSFFLCAYAFHYARAVIDKHGVQPSDNPIPVAFLGRKQGTDFTATTLNTWISVIPRAWWKIKGATDRAPRSIVIADRVAIHFGGLDRQESINKFNSAEYGLIGVDQAEETTIDDVSVLRGSKRRQINGQPLPYKELYTANPASCWLKDAFISSPDENMRFVQALPSDNPHLPDSYIQTLKDAFKHRPELLAAYLYGSWDALEGADQMIKDGWIVASMRQVLHEDQQRHFLSCDPARFGDDETVIYRFVNSRVIETKIMGVNDGYKLANILHTMAINPPPGAERAAAVAIDACGIGGPISDTLAAMCDDQYAIINVNGAEKPVGESKASRYANRRAEMWDDAANMLANGEVQIDSPMDPQLRTQLCTPRFRFQNGKILVERKEEIKKRLGRSPDRADAYVQGLHVMKMVQPVETMNRFERERRRRLDRRATTCRSAWVA